MGRAGVAALTVVAAHHAFAGLAATLPAKPAAAAASVGPIRIRTEALTATGVPSVEVPFPVRIRTQPLTAVGIGSISGEKPFQPVRIRTEALTATGQGAANGGPK